MFKYRYFPKTERRLNCLTAYVKSADTVTPIISQLKTTVYKGPLYMIVIKLTMISDKKWNKSQHRENIMYFIFLSKSSR